MKTTITKCDGCTETINDKDYTFGNWAIGEYEYTIVYDKDGDLYGLENSEDEELQNAINEWVDAQYDYNFPQTLEEYNR